MTPLDDLLSREDPARALQSAAYHKAPRRYLGIPVPVLADLADGWRATRTVEERVALADALWQTDIHEARIAAAKLLVQARLRPDEGAWALIASWVPQFDAWAIADHACDAGARRLLADPSRLDQVESWTTSPNMWTRRAALVMTLPWAKMNKVKPQDLEIRERVLGWAAGYVADRDWFIQKAVAWWLRDLSKHDAARTRAFLAEHGERMKPFARKEAARHLA
ncbi:DNA alkylation repair protein [Rhodobacter sp. SGA-6-6]|uniref:DNA alkylation repair protein n=1 Tax=Rhodobacter sp. SGA-6-6 TaxID=2710882 RepID=UPI0013EA8630|nr:DNA alkylation repair protein [Rhodobacter sp. SGA-6-6]NGM46300.1 DNA alkylation repair protein [Rhodobacter sp. SGA-6-6]